MLDTNCSNAHFRQIVQTWNEVGCVCEYSGFRAPPAAPPVGYDCTSPSQLPDGSTDAIMGVATKSEYGASWGDSCYARPASLWNATTGKPKKNSQFECAAACAE